MSKRQCLLLTCLTLGLVVILLTACGGQAAGGERDSALGGSIRGQSSANINLYLGELPSPHSGWAAFFIHTDDTVEFLIVTTSDINRAKWMTGTINGVVINMQAEVGNARITGARLQTEGLIDTSVTYPGTGFIHVKPRVSASGGLYKGELNGLTAGLILLPDGATVGIAAVEGGDAPVFEFLCVDGTIDGTPTEITAKTCDTEQEITLALIAEAAAPTD